MAESRFEGRYAVSMDAKGRLFFPAKQRDKLDGNLLHITRGLDGCLFAFTDEQWAAFKARMAGLPVNKSRGMDRYFVGNSATAEMDSQGRLTIDPELRNFVNLGKDLTIVGLQERIEIWNTEAWNKINDSLTDDQVDEMLQDVNF